MTVIYASSTGDENQLDLFAGRSKRSINSRHVKQVETNDDRLNFCELLRPSRKGFGPDHCGPETVSPMLRLLGCTKNSAFGQVC